MHFSHPVVLLYMPGEKIINNRILKLLYKKWAKIPLTESEQSLLGEWVDSSPYGKVFMSELENPAWLQNELRDWKVDHKEDLWNKIARRANSHAAGLGPVADLPDVSSDAALPAVPRARFMKKAWFRYAALLLLIVGTAACLYLINRPRQELSSVSASEKPVILPGGNKATLTLADGSTILLDSAANGTLASQGSTKVIKLASGLLAYQADAGGSGAGYNTISTPKGGQYQINLPDGSRVWLNAASSIRFPTVFAMERNITVTGEVYVEIVKDRVRPFIVQAGTDRIEVLGTSLNVNAYSNEPATVTTLLEGSIKIGRTVLKPGEAYANGKKYKAEVERAIAWKNGLFNFEDATLEEIMRQLERWYDIEIDYEGNLPEVALMGKLTRDVPLNELLPALRKMGVHYRLEDRKLTILP